MISLKEVQTQEAFTLVAQLQDEGSNFSNFTKRTRPLIFLLAAFRRGDCEALLDPCRPTLAAAGPRIQLAQRLRGAIPSGPAAEQAARRAILRALRQGSLCRT